MIKIITGWAGKENGWMDGRIIITKYCTTNIYKSEVSLDSARFYQHWLQSKALLAAAWMLSSILAVASHHRLRIVIKGHWTLNQASHEEVRRHQKWLLLLFELAPACGRHSTWLWNFPILNRMFGEKGQNISGRTCHIFQREHYIYVTFNFHYIL